MARFNRAATPRPVIAIKSLDRGSVVVVSMPADVGAFSLSGRAAPFGAVLRADYNGFTHSGQPITFKAAKVSSASEGVFSLNGVATTYTIRLSATYGNLTVNGKSVVVRVAKVLPANYAAFSLSGQTTSYKKVTPAGYGIIILTPSGTRFKKTLSVSNRSISLTGQSVLFRGSLKAGYTAYIYTGRSVALRKTIRVTANYGQTVFTGSTAQFVKIAPSSYRSFYLTGIDVAILVTAPSQTRGYSCIIL